MILTDEIVYTKSKEKNVLAVTDLNIWGFELTNVDVLCKMQNLQKLILTKNCLTTLKPFSSLVNLKELYMRLNNIPDLDELKYIKHLSLEVLALSDNPCCKRAGPKYRSIVLCALPNLRVLDNQNVTEQEKKRALVGEIYDIIDQKSLKKEGNKTENPVQQPKQNQYQSEDTLKQNKMPLVQSENLMEYSEEPMPGSSQNWFKVQEQAVIEDLIKKTNRSLNVMDIGDDPRPGTSQSFLNVQPKTPIQPTFMNTSRDYNQPRVSYGRTQFEQAAGDTYFRYNTYHEGRSSVSSPRYPIQDQRPRHSSGQIEPSSEPQPPVTNLTKAALNLVEELDAPELRVLRSAIRECMDDIRQGYPRDLQH